MLRFSSGLYKTAALPRGERSHIIEIKMSKQVSYGEIESVYLSTEDRQVLDELREQLLSRLPGLVRYIILFGSRARGGAQKDSDMDVLIVLDHSVPDVLQQIRAIRYEIMQRRQFRPLISLLVLSDREWQELPRHSAGLSHNIQREGIVLWLRR